MLFHHDDRCIYRNKYEVDSGDGLMDGFLKCSSDMPGGIDFLDDPNLDKVSATSFFAWGTCQNSQPSK
jgi:hypothetical protein